MPPVARTVALMEQARFVARKEFSYVALDRKNRSKKPAAVGTLAARSRFGYGERAKGRRYFTATTLRT
ncbi:MAG TPA: hypothetical protein VJS42_16065 [Steroidobacteraceae bacterium]|nr:hypothetical protein [Steroidobacteraceae bacterium]